MYVYALKVITSDKIECYEKKCLMHEIQILIAIILLNSSCMKIQTFVLYYCIYYALCCMFLLKQLGFQMWENHKFGFYKSQHSGTALNCTWFLAVVHANLNFNYRKFCSGQMLASSHKYSDCLPVIRSQSIFMLFLFNKFVFCNTQYYTERNGKCSKIIQCSPVGLASYI